jgi:ribosomal protein S12 methylthiotransferase accessory factor YcaO
MNTIQSMKQALDVLMFFRYAPPAQRPMVIKAIADLEQAIKQEEQQPVPVKTYSGGKAWPVQVEWVWLTDEQIEEAVRGAGMSFTPPDFKVARAIEAKLKEMNPKG